MKNILKAAIASSAICLAFTGNVNAENQPDNPWTDCGIGYALFKNSEVGAAISNVIWDAGTTATTTYVSTPDNCRSRDGQVAQFIGESYDSLEKETAIGEGQHLVAMLNILSCEASEHNKIINSVRANFGKTATSESFDSMDKVKKAENYYNAVQASVQNSSCSAS